MIVKAAKINSLSGSAAHRLSDSAMQLIGSLMQVAGVRHVRVEPIQCGGVSRARPVDAQFFDGVPDDVKQVGGAVLEPISDLILSFAVTDVSMEPADGDMEHLRKVWGASSGRLVAPAEVAPDMRELEVP